MKHVFSSRFQGVGRWIKRAVLCLWLVLGAGLPQEVVGSAVPVSAFSIRPLCPDSLQTVERLGREPLLSYASWMYPKKVPTRYGIDNLYQWLTEQSIHSLLSVSVWHPSVAEAAQAAALEFYDDLMAFYRRRQQREAKLAAARTGLERYPQTVSVHDLKEQVLEVTEPSLKVSCPFAYPGVEESLQVRFRNLSGFTLQVYRVDLPVTSRYLEEPLHAGFLRRYARRVDKRMGHPVAGAKVAFYEIAPDRQFQRVEEWTTDAQGRVTLVPPAEKGWLGMHVYRATDAFMEITYAGTQLPSFSKAGTVQAERHVRLFTDRILYRPGQPLQVAGWVYRQEGDCTEALSGASIEGTLRDAHGQVVKQATWRSDSFGSFHDRWVLPDDLLPGEYVLTTADATPCYIRVDEFRRPTFEVALTPPDRVYDWGDTRQLSGYERFEGFERGGCYYRRVHDASTEFFFNVFPKGTWQWSYPVYVDGAGTYQAGSARVQSVYAPAFTAHSETQVLTVEE